MTRSRNRKLSKFYYPTPDELQGAVPLDENAWMRNYQALMLALANTSEGKDLLCIDDHHLPIIGMKRNVVLYGHGDRYMADFRIGAKWGNVVRYRWQEIRRALERVNELWLADRPQALFRGGRMLVPAGATTLTEYPDVSTGNTTCDRQVHRSDVKESFSTLRNGNGTGEASATGTNGYFQIQAHADDGDYTNITRCIYGFDTSSMGASTIDDATASFVGNEWLEGLGRSSIALTGAAPSNDGNIVRGDFQTVSFTALATNLTPGTDWSDGSSSGAYSNFTLNSTGEAYIDTGGVTNFCVMLEWDRANSFGGSYSGGAYTHQGSLLADVTGTSTDPKFVVNYTANPFVPRAIIF